MCVRTAERCRGMPDTRVVRRAARGERCRWRRGRSAVSRAAAAVDGEEEGDMLAEQCERGGRRGRWAAVVEVVGVVTVREARRDRIRAPKQSRDEQPAGRQPGRPRPVRAQSFAPAPVQNGHAQPAAPAREARQTRPRRAGAVSLPRPEQAITHMAAGLHARWTAPSHARLCYIAPPSIRLPPARPPPSRSGSAWLR